MPLAFVVFAEADRFFSWWLFWGPPARKSADKRSGREKPRCCAPFAGTAMAPTSSYSSAPFCWGVDGRQQGVPRKLNLELVAQIPCLILKRSKCLWLLPKRLPDSGIDTQNTENCRLDVAPGDFSFKFSDRRYPRLPATFAISSSDEARIAADHRSSYRRAGFP
jgi:hypothetical protein